ncbi:hypothetical protein JVT61DRAFT_10441 [Boletus reticuloceps]|uniref:RING-type domain-containing protein n=1 Tax=Boletus reticuloceps TaxID=495285 RepID=A0A8I2YV49_9AGAM|nr:hypothetical protein JVT61DRAFT_10441 [Boletus reticuloceps]
MPPPDNTQPQQDRRRGHQHRGRGRGKPPQARTDLDTATLQSHPNTQRDTLPHDVQPPSESQRRSNEPGPSHPPRPSRRERFRAKLTEAPEAQAQHGPPPAEKRKHNPPRRPREPPGDDLTSTLTHALRTPPFTDCPICFNSIRPEQATWSCSPPLSLDDKDVEGSQCCWSTFHLKCIRAWAEKSVKDIEEAWRARGESRPGEWRCPGCRATRQAGTIQLHVFLSAHAQPNASAYRNTTFVRTTVFAPAIGVCTCMSVAVSSGTVSTVCGDHSGGMFLRQGET